VILRRFLSAIVVLASFGVCFSVPLSTLAQEGKFEEALKAHGKAIEEALGDKEKALRYKELGDLFVSRDDYKSAADEFIQALFLYRGFSEKERLQMVVYISWAERYDEAIDELQSILSENPENIEALLHLARTLAWSGRFEEAIDEAEAALRKSPGNRDALLIKANALSWKGKPKEAIPIYKKLLANEEDFDARLGLAHALLSIGRRKAASESSRLLVPSFSYQEREYNKLSEALRRATQSNLDTQYSHYEDSDDNILDRYSILFGFWFYGLKVDLDYMHTEAQDNTRDNRAEEVDLTFYLKPTDFFGVGGGVGYAQAGNGESDELATWSARADFDVFKGALGVSTKRELFAETAELIENGTRVTRTDVSLSQNVTHRWVCNTGGAYRDYSDDNNSYEVWFSMQYAVRDKNPWTKIGYRFRYLDFKRQSGGGYFDPDDFISNQVFASLYYEGKRIYFYIQPYFGQQSFSRFGAKSNDLVGGGYGSVGMKLSDNLTFEAFVEGGNFALDTAAGWKYYLAGVKFTGLF